MADQPIGGDIRTPAAWQLVDLLEQSRARRAAFQRHALPPGHCYFEKILLAPLPDYLADTAAHRGTSPPALHRCRPAVSEATSYTFDQAKIAPSTVANTTIRTVTSPLDRLAALTERSPRTGV
jgi:hypothetical protein